MQATTAMIVLHASPFPASYHWTVSNREPARHCGPVSGCNVLDLVSERVIAVSEPARRCIRLVSEPARRCMLAGRCIRLVSEPVRRCIGLVSEPARRCGLVSSPCAVVSASIRARAPLWASFEPVRRCIGSIRVRAPFYRASITARSCIQSVRQSCVRR